MNLLCFPKTTSDRTPRAIFSLTLQDVVKQYIGEPIVRVPDGHSARPFSYKSSSSPLYSPRQWTTASRSIYVKA